MGIYKPGRPSKFNPATGGVKPPASPGEYRILDSSRNILYIGESNNLARRMNEHLRSGKLGSDCSFTWQIAAESSTSQTRRVHEQQKIRQHSPSLNCSKGGEGRIAQ